MIITCAIGDHEEQELAYFYIQGAYLHTLTDEEVIIILKETLAELMVTVDPTLYRNYIISDSKGVPLLYVNINKAVYCLLKSSLLFYKNLRGQLESVGF